MRQTVLGVEKVELDDDFFELGGDSIRSFDMIARAQELGLQVTKMLHRRPLDQIADAMMADYRWFAE